jgi:hypothetical protein
VRRPETSPAGIRRIAAAAALAAAMARLAGAGPAPASPIAFRDVTKASGIRFRFGTDMRRGRMIATMGGGVAAADFDGDGDLDLFFTGSANNAKKPQKGPCGALYANRGDGTFEDVTDRSGIRSCGWQMGAAWVDFDSDGRPDLVTTGIRCTRLWRNRGDGTFEDVSVQRKFEVGDLFAIGLAAGDYDGDGRVDLYVLGYLDTTPEKELSFPQFQVRFPEDYEGDPGILFHQEPDGTFEDVTARAGVSNRGGKGVAAIFFDYDGDARPDLYITNDRVPNRLYRNRGDGTFEDVTEQTGAGARGEKPRAGMGIAVGDPFDSGFPDIYVTNFSGQTNTFYRNVEGQLFDDATEETRTGKASWPYVQWGTGFEDFDDDGWPDLYAVSGHLVPRFLSWLARLLSHRNLAEMAEGDRSYRQPITLWRNSGDGRFQDASAQAGDLAKIRVCARGSSAGDFDGDGRLDLAVAAISGGARLLRNTTDGAGHAIEILPAAGGDGRTAIGTRVRVTAGGRTWTREFGVVPSYASGSWEPLHFGIGGAGRVDRIEVIPPGATAAAATVRDVAADALYVLQDGRLRTVRRFSR